MKKFIILLQILTASFTYSQSDLKGNFCSSLNGGFNSTCIEFQENTKFKFYTYGCLGMESTGIGDFSFKSNKLILKFDKVATSQKSQIKIENVYNQNKKDSIKLHFEILDGNLNMRPLPANILLGSDSFDLKKAYQANEDGEAIISKGRSSKKEKYKILFVGYEIFEFELSNSSSKNIEIVLESQGPRIISNKVYEYDLEEIKENLIILKDGNRFKRSKS
ncbi:hypothetical protein [Christiangramia portivictoriae]|uniref:hypothetical protein n=1 Tax=Christiangramia portivictoriae TaxID=326069 RepID=UPI0004253B54|nr:hypothetical protein [Christiangramia portivictoriae]